MSCEDAPCCGCCDTIETLTEEQAEERLHDEDAELLYHAEDDARDERDDEDEYEFMQIDLEDFLFEAEREREFEEV